MELALAPAAAVAVVAGLGVEMRLFARSRTPSRGAYFLVPPDLRGRVIVIGIAGALVLRAVAIVAGMTPVERVEAVVYAFGALNAFALLGLGSLLALVHILVLAADRLDRPHPTEEAKRRPPRCPKTLTQPDGDEAGRPRARAQYP